MLCHVVRGWDESAGEIIPLPKKGCRARSRTGPACRLDGAVNAPDTLGKMLGPERFQQLRESRGMDHDGLLVPAEIAETYFHLAQQHRSAWTHEVDLRSFSDRPWWNH